MNISVAALAPTNKIYSMSDSLTTRVAIAAVCLIYGFAKLWDIYSKLLGFTTDKYLLSVLQNRD